MPVRAEAALTEVSVFESGLKGVPQGERQTAWVGTSVAAGDCSRRCPQRRLPASPMRETHERGGSVASVSCAGEHVLRFDRAAPSCGAPRTPQVFPGSTSCI
jgi:hypothetical protein